MVQLCEALLRLEKGPHLLARLIANMPDTFDQGDHDNSIQVYRIHSNNYNFFLSRNFLVKVVSRCSCKPYEYSQNANFFC